HAPRLKELRPDMPEGICKVVDRALEYDKSKRWSTGTMMLLAVRQAMSQLELARSEVRREQALERAARSSDPEIEVGEPVLQDRAQAGPTGAAGGPTLEQPQVESAPLVLEEAPEPPPAMPAPRARSGAEQDKLRAATAALEAFAAQREADERLAHDESETQVVPPTLMLERMAAELRDQTRVPRDQAPKTPSTADGEAAAEERAKSLGRPRAPQPSDEELTVVRDNPLLLARELAQARASEPTSHETAAIPLAEPEPEPQPQPQPQPELPPTADSEHVPHAVAPESEAVPSQDAIQAPTASEPPASAFEHGAPSAPGPASERRSSALSIAATLLAVAGVVVLVTLIVRSSQRSERQADAAASVQAAQVTEPVAPVAPAASSAPAATASPAASDAPAKAAVPDAGPDAREEAETVDLEELPVLPATGP